jgi:hypothetical protein
MRLAPQELTIRHTSSDSPYRVNRRRAAADCASYAIGAAPFFVIEMVLACAAICLTALAATMPRATIPSEVPAHPAPTVRI